MSESRSGAPPRNGAAPAGVTTGRGSENHADDASNVTGQATGSDQATASVARPAVAAWWKDYQDDHSEEWGFAVPPQERGTSNTAAYADEWDRKVTATARARLRDLFGSFDPGGERCPAVLDVEDQEHRADGAPLSQMGRLLALVRLAEQGHSGARGAAEEYAEGWRPKGDQARRALDYATAYLFRDGLTPDEEKGCCPVPIESFEVIRKATPDGQDHTGQVDEQNPQARWLEANEPLIRRAESNLMIAAEAKRRYAARKRAHETEPETFSLRELLARPRTGPIYRVDRLWPAKGKVLITAPKKAGKTTLVQNLIRSLADGDPFLGRPFRTDEQTGGFAVTPGRSVFLFDFEMNVEQVTRWFDEQGIEKQDLVHVAPMRGRTMDLRDDEVRAYWAGKIRAVDAGTLLIDPIGPVLQGLGLDENSNTDVGGFLAAVDRLALEAGVDDYVVVHHAGHGEEQRARGASAFVGWPDAWWQITWDGTTSYLRAEGRDVEVHEIRLAHNKATRRVWLGEGNRTQAKGSADTAVVVEMVTGNPGGGQNDMVRLLRESDGWPERRTRDALAAAVREGVVHVHPGENRRQHHHPGGVCDRCPTLDIG